MDRREWHSKGGKVTGGRDEKATPEGYWVSVDHKKTEAGGHPGSGFRLSAVADYGFSTAVDDLYTDDSVQLFFSCAKLPLWSFCWLKDISV